MEDGTGDLGAISSSELGAALDVAEDEYLPHTVSAVIVDPPCRLTDRVSARAGGAYAWSAYGGTAT